MLQPIWGNGPGTQGKGPSPQLSQRAALLSRIHFIMASSRAGGRSSDQILSRWILREKEAEALPGGPHSGHAAAQLHGKVLHVLLQSLAGIGLCPFFPCPLLLQLGQPQPQPLLPPLAGLQLALGLVQGIECSLSPPLPEQGAAHLVAVLILDVGSSGRREAQHVG